MLTNFHTLFPRMNLVSSRLVSAKTDSEIRPDSPNQVWITDESGSKGKKAFLKVHSNWNYKSYGLITYYDKGDGSDVIMHCHDYVVPEGVTLKPREQCMKST